MHVLVFIYNNMTGYYKAVIIHMLGSEHRSSSAFWVTALLWGCLSVWVATPLLMAQRTSKKFSCLQCEEVSSAHFTLLVSHLFTALCFPLTAGETGMQRA